MSENLTRGVPPVGQRDDKPAHIFLDQVGRRYPYKEKVNGRWVPTARALRAAISVANINGDTEISKRASELLAKLNEKSSLSVFERGSKTMLDRLLYRIAAAVNKNNKGELDALEGYSELLEELTEAIGATENEDIIEILEEGIEIAREVSADERNHSTKWSAYATKLDKIKPSSDGLAAAVRQLISGAGD